MNKKDELREPNNHFKFALIRHHRHVLFIFLIFIFIFA